MMTTITRPKTKPKKTGSNYKRLHVIIPIEDMLWSSQQKPSITQLWQECWTADPYGSRWMPLPTGLGYSTFIAAKKVLSETGLFIFKPDKSILDGRETVGWVVRNLHGSRMKDFWEELDSPKQELDSTNPQINTGSEKIDALDKAPISNQTYSEPGLHEPSQTAQEHLTNSSKEFVRCVSDIKNENSPSSQASGDTPLGGASPQPVECISIDPAPSTANLEKWSDEAIAARREARPMRMRKLKMASIVGENPGFDFLLSCWENDPTLEIMIKKLLLGFPQWGIACVDGVLINLNL